MQKKITDTTATYALGNPYQSRLFSVPSGTWSGRRAALIQTAANEISLAWSDSPGSGWSNPLAVVSDAADGVIDARMTSSGDVHLVYRQQATDYLVTCKLALVDGTWTTGATVVIHNGASCYDPSLEIEPGGTLWVSYARFVSPTRWIYAKSSTDSGVTWGSGPADAGDQISSGSIFAWSRVVVDNESVHVFFHDQDSALSVRSQPLAGGSWSGQNDIATGSGFDRNFDVAVGADGRLGIVFYCDQLQYREYDGSSWGAIVVLVCNPILCPQLIFEGNVAVVTYLDPIGGGMTVARVTDRHAGNYSDPEILNRRSAPLDAVILYDASSDSYEDLTASAAKSTTADVYHPSSGCLLRDEGDQILLGMADRFRSTRMQLSTPGAGGAVMISYWDGANWQAFTPANGASALDAVEVDLLFWTDYAAVPVDWQKRMVALQSRYWIKIEVTSGFTTGPVGSQIAAASETTHMVFRR